MRRYLAALGLSEPADVMKLAAVFSDVLQQIVRAGGSGWPLDDGLRDTWVRILARTASMLTRPPVSCGYVLVLVPGSPSTHSAP